MEELFMLLIPLSYFFHLHYSWIIFLPSDSLNKGILSRNLAEDTVMLRSFMEMIPDCRHLWLRSIQLERLRAARSAEHSSSENLLHYHPFLKHHNGAASHSEDASWVSNTSAGIFMLWSLNKPAFKSSCSAGWNVWEKGCRGSVGKYTGKERDKIFLIKNVSQN